MVSEESARKVIRHEIEDDIDNLDAHTIGRAHETFIFETDSEKYILKASNEKRLEDRFQVEAPVYRLLKSSTDVPVPEIVAFDNSKRDFNFMYFISGFEKGENIDTYEADSGPKFRYLSVERKKKVLESAGEVLGKLHSQTSFKSFGFLESENNELEFRKKSSWKKIFREIIIEEQMENFPERFQDLQDLIRGFVEENLDVLKYVDSPCIIHQDFRWPNVKVSGDKVSTVFDWERAVAGHAEYDLAKAEESLIQVDSNGLYRKYRESLLKGYRKHSKLEDGWERRMQFYKAVRPVEALWTFEGWTEGMNEEKKEAMAEYQRNQLKKRIENYGGDNP
ncbi:MAG: phosphotransferase family protein [Candidatus Nanohalobium sp.]